MKHIRSISLVVLVLAAVAVVGCGGGNDNQATAIAPTAVEAEIRAKAAVLSGPDGAADWLPHGGVLVFDDGSHRVA